MNVQASIQLGRRGNLLVCPFACRFNEEYVAWDCSRLCPPIHLINPHKRAAQKKR